MPAPTAPASPSRARPIVVRADRADASSSRASILPAWLTRGGTVTSAPSRPFGLASRGSPLLSDAAASPRFGAREMGLRDRAASFVRRIGQFEPRDALAWIVVQDGGLGELEVPTSHGDDVESSSADDDALDDAAEADPTGAEIHHGSSPHLRSIEAMGRRSSAPRDQARLAAAASRAAERRRAHSLRRRPQRSRVIARLDRIRRGLGLSRSAAILLVALLLFGVLEIARRNPGADIATQRAFVLPRTSEVDPTRHTSAVWLEQLRVPGPAEPLLLPYRAVNRPAFSRRSRNNLQHRPAIGPAPMPPFGEPPDMTAIILGYRRPAHLQLAVTHLCRYVGTLFSEVLVVNNNAERPLTPSFFTDAGATCPPHALKIRNLRNMMFVSRFLACSTVSAAHCFLADDDFVTWPLRSLAAQYRRDPSGAMVASVGTDTGILGGHEWCFFNQPDLHTCFAWLGAGAMISRARARDYLRTLMSASPSLSADEWALADNYYAMLENRPAYLLQHTQIELSTRKSTFSAGRGRARNKRYMERALARLAATLPPATIESAATPLEVDVEPYRATPPPPWPLHPYAHHSRAPCADDACIFITNVAALPPPDSVRFPYARDPNSTISLDAWENSLGFVGRGWIEGGEMYADGERWAMDWPYQAAVDRDWTTAWRSPDIVRNGDYIGLMLVEPLRIEPGNVRFHVVLDDDAEILTSDKLHVEVSRDGYRWLSMSGPSRQSPTFVCHRARHPSQAPDTSFPSTHLLSPLARRIRTAEDIASSGLRGFWRRRRRQRQLLRDCSVLLERSAGRPEGPLSSRRGDGYGWQFVRLRYDGDASLGVGWSVYEVWLSEA